MSLLARLAVCICWSVSVRCLEDQAVSWPSNVSEAAGFRNMLPTSDGKHLIISGLNGVYNLNTTDFKLLNQATTGPLISDDADDHDDIIKVMIYNNTETDDEGYLTTCSSSRNYCDVRKVNDVSGSVNRLEPPIKIDGAVAFMATYIKSSGRIREEDFLFVGCPHVEGQGHLGGRCSRPGISWYLNSGDQKGSPWYGFKSYEETPILTEKYVEAFNVGNYRLFFSIQRDTSTRSRRSRIAQVCQYYDQQLRVYTTTHTYADMPIQCGQLKEIRAVKKLVVETETLFIAVFSQAMKSAVCVYTMQNIKRLFAVNIKDCYRGGRAPANQDYINFRTSNVPCTRGTTDNATFYMPEDYFLCNKDRLLSFHQVIGNKVLSSDPVVQYNTQLTAVTVSLVGSQIIAFLGTASGDILKAVVYPRNSAVSINQPEIRSVGYMIKQDMYTSQDGKHIFVLTERQVYKLPVESCSGFSTCGSCLGSKDPYCGWCFIEKRCGTRNTCMTTSEWISVASNEKCPHVVRITPTVMSDKEIHMFSIEVSQSLEGARVSCAFHSDEIGGDFDHTVPATVSNKGKTVECMPTNILAIRDRIKGFSNIIVAILANDSDTTIRGNFILYRCETFDRCISCTARNWTCKWCTYSNQCINNDRSCNDDQEVNVDECPRITGYKMISDDSISQDFNGTLYLSRDKDYEINITGTNLPAPRSRPISVSYKCKMVVSGAQILWFNRAVFDERGSFICTINKEEMASIPGPVDRLNATVQVTWGTSPVYGDALPAVIYACENIVKPSYNCGRCKSFALYQPYLHCQWCETRCIDSGIACNTTESECGNPDISKVYPLSAHVNATTLIEVEGVNLGSSYNDTVNAVTIAGIPCTSVESGYEPGIKIMCELSPSYKEMTGNVVAEFSNNATGQYKLPFHFRVPEVTYIEPSLGPLSGGTNVAIYGKYLNTGRGRSVSIGGRSCRINTNEGTDYSFTLLQKYNNSHYIVQGGRKDPPRLVCTTASGDPSRLDEPLDVMVVFDGANVILNETITYRYVKDPKITAVIPRASFQSGGRTLTVQGTNLYSIQIPKIYAFIGSRKTVSEVCRRDDKEGVIYCPSPRYTVTEGKSTKKRASGSVKAKLGFEMDDVSSVTSDNLQISLAMLEYYPDPLLENFTEVKVYEQLQEYLIIKGKNLMVAADEDDVIIKIECETCNVIGMKNEVLICKPPTEKPVCSKLKDLWLIVTVEIGYFHQSVGFLTYETGLATQPKSAVTNNSTIMTVAILVATVVIISAIVGSIFAYRKCRSMHEKDGNSVVFRSQTEESNERRKDGVNEENHPAVSPSHARETSGVYDVIHNNDVINEYLELSGEDPTYTKANEYVDPHPYRKIDNTADEPESKNETIVNDNLTRADLHIAEKNVKPEEIEHQESVDKLATDLDAEYLHPIASPKTVNGALEELKYVAKDDELITDCGSDVDGGYIHPVESRLSGTTATCDTKLETAKYQENLKTISTEGTTSETISSEGMATETRRSTNINDK